MQTFLALFGSGEYTEPMSPIDIYIHNKAQETGLLGPVVLLPTAAGEEEQYKQWNSKGVAYFKKLGIDAVGIDAPSRKELELPENIELLNTASAVYFSGGRPGYLFEQLQNSPFWEALQTRSNTGMPVIGSSAGAMVLGKYFLANPYEIIEKGAHPEWKEGLNLTNLVVLPHYNRVQEGEPVKKLFLEAAKMAPEEALSSLIGIDEDTAYILASGEENKTMGAGEVHLLHVTP